MNRRAIIASLAALPFARPTAAATIPDIHQLRPVSVSAFEIYGALKQAIVNFTDLDHASLIGKTYAIYGTPLVCTKEARSTMESLGAPVYSAFFEEINL